MCAPVFNTFLCLLDIIYITLLPSSCLQCNMSVCNLQLPPVFYTMCMCKMIVIFGVWLCARHAFVCMCCLPACVCMLTAGFCVLVHPCVQTDYAVHVHDVMHACTRWVSKLSLYYVHVLLFKILFFSFLVYRYKYFQSQVT